MNNLSLWKTRLIKWLAGGEPVLLNWDINPQHIKGNASVVYIPLNDARIPHAELSKMGVLTPTRNAIRD